MNDAPNMVTGGTVTVNEDFGAYSNLSWATDLRPGPSNEAGQTLTRTTTNDNNALFAVQPVLSATGGLTFTPAANASGSALVTFTLTDNGGTANGGVNTATYTALIQVLPVNDAPSFNLAQTVINLVEDQGAGATFVQADIIVSPSTGPADESAQVLSYIVTVTGDNVFALAPTIQTSNLVFSLAENAYGTATLTITARDDGGTANGGVDTSAPKVVTVIVSGVNDAPIVANDAVTIKENHPIDIDVLGNDFDIEGMTLTISAVDSSGTNGTVTRINANTAIRFVPNTGYKGTTTFTYTASDGSLTATATVTVLVEQDSDGPVLINSSVTNGELLNRGAISSGGALWPAKFEFDDYNFDENSPTVTAALTGTPLAEMSHFVVDRIPGSRSIEIRFFNLESVKTFNPSGELLTISLDNIKDDLGNLGDPVEVSVVLDLVAPSFTWYDFGHDPEMRAVALFSESMDVNSFNTFVFEEKITGVDVLPDSYDGPGFGAISKVQPNDGFYFIPASPLESGKEYRVEIGNFTDLAGNKLAVSPNDFEVCCAYSAASKVVRVELLDASDTVVHTFTPDHVTRDTMIFPASIDGQVLDLRLVFDHELSTEWNASYLSSGDSSDAGDEFMGFFESVYSGTNNAMRFGGGILEWDAQFDYVVNVFALGVTEGGVSRRLEIIIQRPDDGHAPYVTVVNGWSAFFGKPEIRAAEPLFIAFSERLDRTRLGPDNFEIRNGATRYPVVFQELEAGLWLRAADGNGKPIALPLGTNYTLEVKDLADLSTPPRVGAPESIPFAVISPWDGILTQVASSNPADGSSNVAFRPIHLVFTLPIDAYSLVGSGPERTFRLAELIGDTWVPVRGYEPAEPNFMPQQRIQLGQRYQGLMANSHFKLQVDNALDVNGRNLTTPYEIEFSTGSTTSTGPVILDADVRLDIFAASFTLGGIPLGDTAEIGLNYNHANYNETFTYGLSNLFLGGGLVEAVDLGSAGFYETTLSDIDLFFAQSAYSTLVHTIDDSAARRDMLRQQVYRLGGATLLGAAPSWLAVSGKPGVYEFSGTVMGLDAAEIKSVEIYVGVLNTATNDLQGLVYQAPAQVQWEIGTQALSYAHTMPEQAALPTLPAPLEYVAFGHIRVPQKMVARPIDSSGITRESTTFNP